MYCLVIKVLLDSIGLPSYLQLEHLFQNISCFSTYAPYSVGRIHVRRWRDLNPRAATNDLLPFQGSPFSLLGTSPRLKTERVGFEPTCPFGQTVFKTASLWPLRYLSIVENLFNFQCKRITLSADANVILPNRKRDVN